MSLRFLSAGRLSFIVAGYQGKIHAGWKPPNGPTDAFEKMVELLKQEMVEILEYVNRRRRSDSYPREEEEDSSEIVKESQEKAPGLVRKWFSF